LQTTIIYFLNLAFLGVLTGLFFKSERQAMPARLFFSAWLFKMACGILLGMLFYFYYQTGDTLAYFENAKTLSQLLLADFWQALTQSSNADQPVRAILFTKIVSVLLWATKANYWICSLYFSLISFFGSVFLVQQLTLLNQKFRTPATLAFLFLPSTVFWSSGLLKESLIFGCICYVSGCYVAIKRNQKIKWMTWLLAGIAMMLIVAIKYYIAAVFIPLLAYLIVFHFTQNTRLGKVSFTTRSGIILLILLIPAYAFVFWLSPNLRMEWIGAVIRESHLIMIRACAPQNTIVALHWFGNSLDIPINFVYYLFSGLFRPIFPEVLNFPGVLSSLESLSVFILGIVALTKMKKVEREYLPELLAIFVLVIVLSVLLSYTLPNFGTLARMKIYYFPFLVFLILIPLKPKMKIL